MNGGTPSKADWREHGLASLNSPRPARSREIVLTVPPYSKDGSQGHIRADKETIGWDTWSLGRSGLDSMIAPK